MFKIKKSLFVICTLFFSILIQAQDFPATEKAVSDILVTGKWSLDSLGRPGKMKAAADVSMQDVVLIFKSDGTYTITVFGKDKAGKWATDLAGKEVKMFENKTDPESLIKNVTKDQLLMVRGDGSDLKMTFRPATP
jgi:hypothetical protein